MDQTPVLISVTLEKGNLLNGSAVAQALPGTGGLGDGSPEVSFLTPVHTCMTKLSYRCHVFMSAAIRRIYRMLCQ